MTQLELHTMQFEYFWNSGWIYNSSLESSKRYKYLWDKTLHNLKPDTIMNDQLLPPQEFLDLQVLWFLYQFSPLTLKVNIIQNISTRDWLIYLIKMEIIQEMIWSMF